MAGIIESGDHYEVDFIVEGLGFLKEYTIDLFLTPSYDEATIITLFLVEFPEYEPLRGNIRLMSKRPIRKG